jgi:pyrroline-5-carboxylate reductase
MGYTLCVLGCGTMGVAILSGVAASLDPHARALAAGRAKWEAPTPGTRTPANEPDGTDDTVPARFVACVSREESARRLRGVFDPLGALGAAIDVRVRENVAAVREADVVLLG